MQSNLALLLVALLYLGSLGPVVVAGHEVGGIEEGDWDFEGVQLDGGISDDKLDALEEANENKRQVLQETMTIESAAGSDGESIGKTDEKRGLYCNDQKIEPSFMELLAHIVPDVDMGGASEVIEVNVAKLKTAVGKLIPAVGDENALSNIKIKIPELDLDDNHPIMKTVDKLKEAGKISSDSIDNLTRQEVPIMALISNGVFTLKSVGHADSITMIQQNYASVNILCNSKAAEYLGPLRGILCSCYGAETVGSQFAGRGDGSSHSSQWCLTRSLCENTRRGSTCKIIIDPFRTTCISYTPGISFESIDYSREIPVVDMSGGDIGNLLSTIGQYLQQMVPAIGKRIDLAKVLGSFGAYLDYIMAYIPSYLFNMVMGILLVSQADELSSSALFQYVLAATFGALLAVVWILLALYRTTETMMKNSAPMFAPGLGAVFIFSSSWILNQSAIRNMIVTSAVAFWETGAPTPFPWAGKVYFLTSMAVSIFLTTYFGLFSPRSNSRYVLRSLIQIFGFILLSQSTSNFEVSCLVVVFGMTQDQLYYWSYRIWLSYTASTQKASSKLMGRALYTRKELDEVSRITTERELAKLRAHLLNSPVKADQYANKLRQGGKTDEAHFLNKFLAGAYHLAATPLVPGTPGFEEIEEDMGDSDSDEDMSHAGGSPYRSPTRSPQKQRKPKSSRWLSAFTWLVAIAIIVSGVIIMQRSMKLSSIESVVEKLGLFKAIALDTIHNFRRNYKLS